MRIEVAHNREPGSTHNFVVHAETRSEAELLRQFSNHGYRGEPQRLFLHSHGGNITEGIESFCFGWRKESDFKAKSWWRALWHGRK